MKIYYDHTYKNLMFGIPERDLYYYFSINSLKDAKIFPDDRCTMWSGRFVEWEKTYEIKDLRKYIKQRWILKW